MFCAKILGSITRGTPNVASRCFLAAKNVSHDYSTQISLKVAPIKRVGETVERKRARLVYQSRKRGILETDLLLSRFAAKHLNSMTPQELEEYDSLLDELDWDIYYWATKNYTITPLPDKFKDSKLLLKLQEFSENKEKQILRMPDLHQK
ncbi:LANO_0A04170g1_1 [Lachancea nothofagi CBS 11611]|uniref:Succinate dehydrogenase assembly factor 2, mitochondrial n=1 Tax=Lachancea nothofagi CBS 11611 TaxID=1266666 RepID=A0A1G4IQM7_9SACH|nr:LANO_0A04170g1_1 [Lachancea nothofagi CBS 11611]